ncbi:TPA: WG repeat-containing protein [Klebsiella aerogenes]|nr:WG repeat-containing protein [Klebsiella aerogenes]
MNKDVLRLALAAMCFTSVASAQSYSCKYLAKISAEEETLVNCASWVDGEPRFSPRLSRLALSANGLYQLYISFAEWPGSGRYYLLNDRSEALSLLPFDNGGDEFAEGLVRSRQQGKVGFYNAQLQAVIIPQFDFAWPFKEGKALVCNGCNTRRDGEHTSMIGGQWFYIDKSGARISPIGSKPGDLLP